MAKRFTDIEKWEDPWYRRLSVKHKVFWQYLCDNSDNAGVWNIDYELASFYIGEKVEKADIDSFNVNKERVVFVNDHYLVIKDFIVFQIGNISEEPFTNLQKNCISLIRQYLKKGIDILKICSLTGSLPVVMDKGTGIGKGKDISKDNKIISIHNSIYTKGEFIPKKVKAYKAPDPKEKFKFIPECKPLIKSMVEKKGELS